MLQCVFKWLRRQCRTGARTDGKANIQESFVGLDLRQLRVREALGSTAPLTAIRVLFPDLDGVVITHRD